MLRRFLSTLPAGRTVLALAAIAVLTLSTGCAKRFSLRVPEVTPAPPQAFVPGKLAVVQAADNRGTTHRNLRNLDWVPFVLWGPMEYDRPEKAKTFVTIQGAKLDMPKAVTLSVADYLRRAGVARDVVPVEHASAVAAADADYFLHLDLNETRYRGRSYSYGLSMFGSTLHYLGFPMGTSESWVDLGMRLEDRSGNVVWRGAVKSHDLETQGIYYNMWQDLHTLQTALGDGLSSTIAANPMRVTRAGGSDVARAR